MYKTGYKFIRTNSIAGKTIWFHALAIYESNDITDNAKLLFIRNIEFAFQFYQALVSLYGLKGTSTGKEKEPFIALELVWERLASVTTGGGRSIYCS